jgi:hypothetical protein
MFISTRVSLSARSFRGLPIPLLVLTFVVNSSNRGVTSSFHRRLDSTMPVQFVGLRRGPNVCRLTLCTRLWGTNPIVRQRWLIRGVRLFEEFLNQFWEIDELPISNDVWKISIDLMGSENLDATDSLHVATARAYGIDHFFTADADFRRITTPEVHLIRDTDN